jgi:hypothetical protein
MLTYRGGRFRATLADETQPVPELPLAANDVQEMRQYDFRREDKWSFADPDSSHPLIKFFRGRLCINHKGTGHHLLRARHGCPKRIRPIPHFQRVGSTKMPPSNAIP